MYNPSVWSDCLDVVILGYILTAILVFFVNI
jgi:hypothetical protein